MTTSLDPLEIAHFAKDSAHWWDENGPFKPLHRLNPIRLRYIRDEVVNHFGLPAGGMTPLTGLSILDVGCGGGLVCEPLTRLGAAVTGIDADETAIEAARAHAGKTGLAIDYKAVTAEALLASPSLSSRAQPRDLRKSSRERSLDCAQERSARDDMRAGDDGKGFDVVLALEIVEHVSDPGFFIRTCASLCRPGGLVIASTLNRTPQSFMLGIVAAEFILGWVPRGTHSWQKFMKPSELAAAGRAAGLREKNVQGYGLNPLTRQFSLFDNDVAVNYFMTFEKGAQA